MSGVIHRHIIIDKTSHSQNFRCWFFSNILHIIFAVKIEGPMTSARSSGSSSVVSHMHAAAAAADIRQQLITELFMQHGYYPSCKLMSGDVIYCRY